MSDFERPTLVEIADRSQQDFESRLDSVGVVLRRSVVRVLARVVAGASHMLHGHLDFLARQLFPDQSEAEYLRRQGELFGITATAAEFATGRVVIWGTDSTIIPISTVLIRADLTEYTTDAEVTITTLTAWATGQTIAFVGTLRSNSGNIYVALTTGVTAGVGSGPASESTSITDNTVTWCFVAAGTAAISAAVTASVAAEDGNADLAVSLSFESPVAGANSTAMVSADGLTGGADEEEEEDLRVRVLERMAEPPLGGAAADYRAWAKEVSGVTRAWVTPQENGPGSVVVRFVRDNDASPIPDAGEVDDVQDKLDEEAPAHATPFAVAPTASADTFTISLEPDTSVTRAAVEAELEDLYLREGEPGGTILLSAIRTAIGTAAGITDYTMASPVADVTHTTNQLPTVGVVTFT